MSKEGDFSERRYDTSEDYNSVGTSTEKESTNEVKRIYIYILFLS